MSNRYFSKNKKSYKRVFKILRPKKGDLLKKLDECIKTNNQKDFDYLIKSVEDKELESSVRKIIETKTKLKL